MAINIDMSNINIGGNAKILNNASLSGGDVKINMNGMKVDGDAVLMEGFVVNDFYTELNNKVEQMDTDSLEYKSIKRILQIPESNKRLLSKEITKHLYDFSKGVLQNVLANYLSRGF